MFLCVLLVAGTAVGTTLVVQGARENLRLSLAGMSELGSDLVVVPGVSGANRTGQQSVDLEGLMMNLSAVPGVATASPQQSLLTLTGSPFSREAQVFVVAFDPATDFIVLTGLQDDLKDSLSTGEAIAGSQVSVPAGQPFIDLAGYELELAGRLTPTGGPLDRSLFISFETARDMTRHARDQVEYAIHDSTNNLPIILVQTGAGSDAGEVATRILKDVPGVSILDGDSFFRTGRGQMLGLLRRIPGLLTITWALSIVFIGLVFSLAANERRREIGVLRALGSTRSFVLRSLLAEGFLLALGGGTAGAVLVGLGMAVWGEGIGRTVGIPLSSPSAPDLALLAMESLAVAVFSTLLATLYPAWRISRQDPALAMRG